MRSKATIVAVASFLALGLTACSSSDPEPVATSMEGSVTVEETDPNTGVSEEQEETFETSAEAISLAEEFVETSATTEEASQVLDEKNYPWRISKINEENLALTMDYMPNRFNFEVEGNDETSYVIVKVTFG